MIPINFKAGFIAPATIKKLDNDEYKPYQVSFVEFNPREAADLKTMMGVSSSWKKADFAKSILDHAIKSANGIIRNNKFFALTTQKDSFEYVKPESVMGLVEYEVGSKVGQIQYIQTNPKYIQKESSNYLMKIIKKIVPEKSYKKIGTAMLDSIKTYRPNNPLFLYAVDDAVKFYENNGFQCYNDEQNFMVWTPDESDYLLNN